MNKNACLNTSEAAEIDECQLNSFISIMRISTPFLAPVFKNDKSDCLLCQFVPTHNKVYFIRLSKKVNHHTITTLNPYQSVQVAAMYKWKANKIQPVSSFESNERASESDSDWWQQIINAEKAAGFHQRQREFDAYFTLKFSDIEEFFWLTQKQVDRLIVNNLRFKKCELLLWMLRNQKKAFA